MEVPEINLDAFIPRVGRSYFSPQVITIASGTKYDRRTFSRPVILIALTPESVGTIYAYPGSTPGDGVDGSSIPSTTGIHFLDAAGDWNIRHTGATAQQFRVIDAGGAGNAQAAMTAAAPAFANLNARLVPITWGAETLVDIDNASELLLAANPSRRGIAVKNVSAASQVITLSITNPAVEDTGFLVLAAGEGYIWSPLDCVTVQAIYAISDAANGALALSEGT